KVEYVNPAYTSQRCPVCGSVHHARDRNYTCSCGFRIHHLCNFCLFVTRAQ
ncbi:zinc ribbon domain-containing protein, partial [Bulleidia sp. HCP3S3_F2]|uniref:zinc ribbon domain-containing protein n=1 Tax=unclassified Bulleidia TaxID=2704656 RepID=UPI003F8BF49F